MKATNVLIFAEDFDDDEPVEHPHIIIKDDYCMIMIDGVAAVQVKELKYALVILFCCYWIFNLAYSKDAKSLLIFIQKVILSINDNAKLDAKVSTLCNKLNRV